MAGRWMVITENDGAINLLKRPQEDVNKLTVGQEINVAWLTDDMGKFNKPVTLTLFLSPQHNRVAMPFATRYHIFAAANMWYVFNSFTVEEIRRKMKEKFKERAQRTAHPLVLSAP